MSSSTYRASEKGRAAIKAAGLRYAQTAKGKASQVARAARYHEKLAALGLTRKRTKAVRVKHATKRRLARDEVPFVGVDGEGWGTDATGRQHYMLMRAKGPDYDAELFTGHPLHSMQCLEFIASLPPIGEAIAVGFSFGYDVTMILRDVPKATLDRLFAKPDFGPGHSRYAWYGDFGLEYLPKNYFRVCRVEQVWKTVPTDDGGTRRYQTFRTIPGSARTIWETFGFHQRSFAKTVDAFGLATPEELEVVRINKADRSNFDAAKADTIRGYCGIECDLLARIMAVFRGLCIDADLRPKTWNGAGKISAAAHQKYGTMTAKRLAEVVPADVLTMASAAYYGGRFEVTRVGRIPGPLYEYDINSAYPAAMAELPCLEHSQWEQATAKWLRNPPAGACYVAHLRFHHHPPATGRRALCGLPIRLKSGRICWPVEGVGTYWSCEIDAARKLGCQVYPRHGYRLVTSCDCQQFGWCRDLYEYRRSLGKSLKGEPVKYAINASYGKLAQRLGVPKWGNLLWAGMITAITRARLIDAAAADPEAIAMLATDGIISTRPLPVSVGPGLGEWEAAEHPSGMFIVQPGIYWGGSKRPKTRGVAPNFFEDLDPLTGRPRRDTFEQAWERYAEQDRASLVPGYVQPPVVGLPVTLFVGMKLAHARGKPETAGVWKPDVRQFDFDWLGKRGRHEWETPLCVWTHPPLGGPTLASLPHRTDREAIAALDAARDELDDQPAPIDMTPTMAGAADDRLIGPGSGYLAIE